jgi:hypothetical protein
VTIAQICLLPHPCRGVANLSTTQKHRRPVLFSAAVPHPALPLLCSQTLAWLSLLLHFSFPFFSLRYYFLPSIISIPSPPRSSISLYRPTSFPPKGPKLFPLIPSLMGVRGLTAGKKFRICRCSWVSFSAFCIQKTTVEYTWFHACKLQQFSGID